MAIISDKYQLIFIMNPRTGCTADCDNRKLTLLWGL